MTELSGTLDGLGLSAIVRFLSGLHKTGCLRLAQYDWYGEVYFDAGQLTHAVFGSRTGISALDALIEVLPRASFTFDSHAAAPGPSSIQLDHANLLAHLDEAAARVASGQRSLPAADAVPVQATDAAAEEPVQLDRATLQTLMLVDAQRSVREIVGHRGSLDALWHLAHLRDLGLIHLRPADAAMPPVAAAPPTVAPAPEPAPPPTVAGPPAAMPAASAAPPPAAPAFQMPPAAPVAAEAAPPPAVAAAYIAPAAQQPGVAAPPAPISPAPPPTVTAAPPAAMPAVSAAPAPGIAVPYMPPAAPPGVTAPPVPLVPPAVHAAEPAAMVAPPDVAATPAVVPAPELAPAHCPSLGFDDDPASSFGRPTRLHRCFAAGRPLPLSLDQQRELCLSDQYPSCPRLAGAAQHVPSWRARPAATRPEPAADDPRIVHLPLPGRATPPARNLPLTGRANSPARNLPHTDGATPPAPDLPLTGRPPTRERGLPSDAAPHPRPLRRTMPPAREAAADSPEDEAVTRSPMVSPPTPLRARLRIASEAMPASADALNEPPTAPDESARPPQPEERHNPAETPLRERRIGPVPLMALPAIAVVAIAVGAILFVLPQLDGLSSDSIDTSALPNASLVAAGTPVSALTLTRATPAAAAAPGQDSQPSQPTTSAQTRPTQPPARATAVDAQATPAASPQSNALFDEHFTANDAGWPSNPVGTAVLTNGTYRIATRQAGQFAAIGAPIANIPADVVVSATFRKLAGPPGGGYGIIVRNQESGLRDGTRQDGHYYVLEAGDKGEVGIWRRDTDHWVDLLPWQHSDAVKPGNATNDVEVRAIGSTLSLSVNGTQVATRSDSTLTAGNVGLFVGGDGNQVDVSRFTVQAP
jgi:uncharacterized protein DUF4388